MPISLYGSTNVSDVSAVHVIKKINLLERSVRGWLVAYLKALKSPSVQCAIQSRDSSTTA